MSPHPPPFTVRVMWKTEGEGYKHKDLRYTSCRPGNDSVLFVLTLQHVADPTIRNLKNESPLDLASQYGRLETVQLLLRKHPNLLDNTADDSCPLHLAARHGHKQVVEVLLDAGLDINRKVSGADTH